ncbi:hypothetical protein BKH42_08595 [Helicobacter sp. 13S00482-2]|uniref:hypothetical protein n=1 Tax=Helicobacter sp. 13S00482-2 TaxID=1476200 RepID=UPI000BA503C2|nr:hypothetical protein [Helicobacter sp. 13S00482-2]PAF52941.1 hypothetical protein BKH42_08595 [Helicobacter sp. 13S00482-2]
MNKIALSIIVAGILGNIALADDLDEQIKKLEKENKLLELKKKKKQLEMQMISDDDAQTNGDLTSDKKISKVKNQDSKNGIFIGVEGSIFSAASGSKNPVFGLMGGYQHYFGDSQKHGIKASVHGHTNLDSITYDFSIDVKYLWDFFETGKHTLGLNVGLGFSYFYYTDKYSETIETASGLKYISHSEKTSGLLGNAVIGLHYYYGHHQFELLSGYPDILAVNYAYRF